MSTKSTTGEIKYKRDELDLPHLVTKNRDLIKSVYKPWFEYISKETDIEESVVYAYFIYETGGTSELWAKYKNPGGIKGSGVKFYDDCDGPCNFRDFSSLTMRQIAQQWVKVFNLSRYDAARNKSPAETCKALMYGGYHSSKQWYNRYLISKTYVQ